MRKTRKLVSAVLAASMVAGIGMGSVETYARSSMRAAWNDASSSKTTGTAVKDACYVEDGSETAEKDGLLLMFMQIAPNGLHGRKSGKQSAITMSRLH